VEVPQGKSLRCYLKQAKKSFLSFSLFLIQIWRAGGNWYQWDVGGGREMVKEGEYGANNVYTYL
jgi:hypothetical protein